MSLWTHRFSKLPPQIFEGFLPWKNNKKLNLKRNLQSLSFLSTAKVVAERNPIIKVIDKHNFSTAIFMFVKVLLIFETRVSGFIYSIGISTIEGDGHSARRKEHASFCRFLVSMTSLWSHTSLCSKPKSTLFYLLREPPTDPDGPHQFWFFFRDWSLWKTH